MLEIVREVKLNTPKKVTVGHPNPYLNVLNPNIHEFVPKYNYYNCKIPNPENVYMKLNPQAKSFVSLKDCNKDHLDEADPSYVLNHNTITSYCYYFK